MGGASSRFDQTQWWNADGELAGDVADGGDAPAEGKESREFLPTILPSGSPTSSLEIFDILKCKSITSQRDFEVKDSNKKVIYETRPVPGTMAWFDVIRPGTSDAADLVLEEDESDDADEVQNNKGDETDANGDKQEDGSPAAGEASDGEEALLRVQVDWHRRSWNIYATAPIFPGQLPATLPIRKGLAEDRDLYKSCCITLSWSKGIAIVTRYGPPTKLQDFWEDGDDDDETTDESPDDGGGPPSADDAGAGNHRESLATRALFTKAESIAARSRKEHDVDVDPTALERATSQSSSAAAAAIPPADNEEVETTGGVMDSLAQSVRTYWDPALQSPKAHMTKAEKQRLSLEGVINLDAPLLQCQTILGKRSHFQTRLIEKDELVKLWVLDDEWNKERSRRQESGDDSQGSIKSPLAKAVAYELAQLKEAHDVEELKKWFPNEYLDEDRREATKEVPAGDPKAPAQRPSLLSTVGRSTWFSFRAPQDFDGNESIATLEEPSESSDAGDGIEPRAEQREKKKVYGSTFGVPELPQRDGGDGGRKEPLVSHWRWKNTYTTHKMQMHLARNSDLALHAVLSIVMNLCRYEWH